MKKTLILTAMVSMLLLGCATSNLKEVKFKMTTDYDTVQKVEIENLKPNTKYLVICEDIYGKEYKEEYTSETISKVSIPSTTIETKIYEIVE